MANINKIKLSGTTYSIQDENATKTVELTQAQYDALAVKDPNTFYIITDATAGDLSNYYTKSETSGATEISTALATKQATLVSGTNIKTINNESILGSGNITIEGGGKAIEAGRGIKITTGETADTVSFNLPLSSSTIASDSIVGGYFGNTSMAQYGFAYGENANCGNNGAAAIALGRNVTANGTAAIALGSDCTAKLQSVSIGRFINTNILGEIGVGIYNVSSSASTTFGNSGNTLFSVGNGTANNARHNAFEIRQNGDIYITLDGQDVKLQDQLGGGGGSDINVVQTTGTSTADVMSQDAVTTQLNNKADKSTAGGGLVISSVSNYDILKLSNQNGQHISGYYKEVSFSKINGKHIIGQGSSNPNSFSLIETSAITTSITSSSTDSQIPSAKAVYDVLGNIETLLSQI